MIGSLGVPELLFILVLALLVFGPRKLPEIGRTLGRALGEFRRATSDLKRTLDVELTAEDLKPPTEVKTASATIPKDSIDTPAGTDPGNSEETPAVQTDSEGDPDSTQSIKP